MIINMGRLISQMAQNYSQRTALVSGEVRLSFQQVKERIMRLANSLIQLGLKPDDCVALISGNCHQFVEIFFARYLLCTVELTPSPRVGPKDWAHMLNESKAKAIFVASDYIEQLLSIRDQLATVNHIIAISDATDGLLDYEELISQSSAAVPDINVDLEKLGRIMYTGGTTGRPKGVMITRRADLAMVRNVLFDLAPDLTGDDVFLGLQPLYHAVRPFFFPCWMRGACQVIVSRFDPDIAFPIIEKEKVTVIKTVPTILVRMVSDPSIRERYLSSLRTIIYGASPMPVERLKDALKIFGPILVQNYGQTEAAMTVCLLRKEDHIAEGNPRKVARLASIGRPYSFVEVKIVDDNGNEVLPGEVGEVIVHGEHQMMGYLNMPDETSAALKNGWVYTGDIGRRDEEGFIFLLDRKKDMIISGGLNIYPGEVEQVLYQHPAVMEAAVFGVPDDRWGEAVTAAVAFKPGMWASQEELLAFCKERLPGFKKPHRIYIKDNLPKGSAGKISRKALAEPFWAGRDRRIA
jgi:long-chain acyl-CoA synthetase